MEKTITIINNLSGITFRYTSDNSGTYDCEYFNYNPYRESCGVSARDKNHYTRANIVAHIRDYRKRLANRPGAIEVVFG